MKGDSFAFFAILIVIFLVWAATGGPSRPISFAGPFLTPVQNVGGRSDAYGSTDTDRYTLFGDLRSAERKLESLTKELRSVEAFGEPSVHRGSVRLSRARASENRARDEYVTISVSGSAPVSITGWKLVSSATGAYGVIGSGVEVVRTGQLNSTSAIVLNPGDEAHIFSGRSPIGLSFRENVCSGYLEEDEDFVPSLKKACPLPRDEFERFYPNALGEDDCYNFIRTEVDRCVTVEKVPNDLSYACRNFIKEKLTYNGCVSLHQNDSRFKEDTWRVYLGSTRELWKESRESIKLLDASGKTVDLITY